MTTLPHSIPESVDSTAVRFTGVSKRFGQVVALHNLNLTIAEGSIVALLGPNGAGKTTAINLMLGLLKPSAGRVELAGKNPRVPRNRQVIGAMLQDMGAPDTLRVDELLTLWSSYYDAPLPVDFVLELAGLTQISHQLFGKLSGGQRQRVAFGLAICGNPDILFLDEPTTGLDLVSRGLLWQQLRHFSRTDRTVILSTHHLDEADSIADRIVLLDRGSVIADGTPAQIKAKVGGKRIRCHTRLDVAMIERLPLVTSARQEGNLVQLTTCDAETVLRTLLALDPALSNLEVSGIGLEEAFLYLTQNPLIVSESNDYE